MAHEAKNTDTIFNEIDEGVLHPTSHRVVRAMHRHMRLKEPVQKRTVDAFDHGQQGTHGAILQSEMWAAMEALPADQQSGLRLSNCLARPDQTVDWHLAEYLTLWARQEGLSEEQIIEAFYGI